MNHNVIHILAVKSCNFADHFFLILLKQNRQCLFLLYFYCVCVTRSKREKSRVHGAISFGFASNWLKNWRDSFKPITKRSNRNHVITFDSHLKTALYAENNYASAIGLNLTPFF